MLKNLKMTNVGPAPTMELEFGSRLNLLTGDNGLGKSFLLDIAWWALTRKWPAEINPKLTAGKKAMPAKDGKASIEFSFTGKTRTEGYPSSFDRHDQAWTGRPGRPSNPGLVLYAMVDGSFAVWDPARNYWKTKGKQDVQERLPAYVFSPAEVWDGLPGEEGKWLCNGLIRDWAGWQKEKGDPFKRLSEALKSLAPADEEPLVPGKLTRISLDDARDIPTLRMPYGQDVPILHASAGMRRICALAYLLVWAWEEHLSASKLLGKPPSHQAIFLVDEVESHLHPRWQLRIVRSVLDVMKGLAGESQVQLIAATHSPLVMASVESVFDQAKDAWFDLDYDSSPKSLRVLVTRRAFEPRGDISNWLTSEAFDLPSARNPDYEALIREAGSLIEQPAPAPESVRAMHERLLEALSPKDPFLFRWRAICEKKGLLA
ncbi:MAG: AAA family ATPase [Candidatus Anammoximicrobium sp.]|nr:AAA family ATPase [Candidatus Anammoximicrobium sp.]